MTEAKASPAVAPQGATSAAPTIDKRQSWKQGMVSSPSTCPRGDEFLPVTGKTEVRQSTTFTTGSCPECGKTFVNLPVRVRDQQVYLPLHGRAKVTKTNVSPSIVEPKAEPAKKK